VDPRVTEPLHIGVVGLGYWGPNLARNFAAIPGAEVTWLCDADESARARVSRTLPAARTTAHCFVEKPLAQSAADAERAVAAAQRADRLLMVGHLLEYHPGVRRLKAMTESGELGEIYYIYGNRLNLGKLRADENALWSLGAHDVSVVLYLADEEPIEVHANGESYVQPGVEDVVFCFMRFRSGLSAHLHLSWLDPHKERRFTVVGSQKMATFDDMELERKLTVYDKGFDEDSRTYGEYITRSGDVFSPRVPNVEPLRVECEHFVDAIRSGQPPRSDGASGLRVVRVLEQLQASLDAGRRRS
jgi:predicted dehydrogenase